MRPLDDIRVVDIAMMIAGPMTSMLLADLGADVIKVEPPRGDDLRYMNWRFAPEAAPFFLAVNRNKRDIVLDIRSAEGLDVLFRLIERADVLTHNFRPGVAERLGVGYENVRERNPALVYCAISAWGERGPWAKRPGIHSLVQAMGGLMSITGEMAGPFLRAGVPLIDTTTPLAATTGILAALAARSRTGVGEKVEVSLLSQGLYLQGPMYSYAFDTQANPPRMGNRSPVAIILEGATPTGGLLVGIPTQKFWVKVCECVDRLDLIEHPDYKSHELRLLNQTELAHQLEPIFSHQPREYWLERLVHAGVPCAPINDYQQVLREEQVTAIEAFLKIDHPVAGQAIVPNAPWHLESFPTEVRRLPPSLGRDTDEVLKEHGFSDDQIRSLYESGITRGAFIDPAR